MISGGQPVETTVLYLDEIWLHFWSKSDNSSWLLLGEGQNSLYLLLYGLPYRRLQLLAQVIDYLFRDRTGTSSFDQLQKYISRSTSDRNTNERSN